MRLIELKERARVFEEQARIQSSESDAREEEVLAWKHDVSFKSKSKCLICKGQYSPSSADMCCAVLVLCALKKTVQWICAGDIKIKSVQMLNGARGPFLESPDN